MKSFLLKFSYLIMEAMELFSISKFIFRKKYILLGVSAPSYKKIAKVYNIKYLSVKNDKDSKNIIKQSLVSKEADIIEVFIHPNQKIYS